MWLLSFVADISLCKDKLGETPRKEESWKETNSSLRSDEGRSQKAAWESVLKVNVCMCAGDRD